MLPLLKIYWNLSHDADRTERKAPFASRMRFQIVIASLRALVSYAGRICHAELRFQGQGYLA